MALPISTAAQKDYRDDLTTSGAPWGVDDSQIVAVKAVGQGIQRGNNSQAVKTFSIVKTSVGGETFYVQVATVDSTRRVFFLGIDAVGASDLVYVEDASSGNVAISDGGSVALANEAGGWQMLSVPRECKRGIRVAVVVGAGATSTIIVYYMEERTDGGLQSL